MDVRLPDGTTITNVPEGTTQEDLLGRLQLAKHPAADRLMREMAAQQATKETSGTGRFLAGAGKAFTDIGRGAGQLSGLIPQSEIDASKLRDQPLMQTGAGMAGNILGNAAVAAPAFALPGAGTYAGAAALGGIQGALQPVGTGESRALNTGFGAGAGLIGQGVGNLIGRGLRPVTSALSPEKQALAQAATREGIPLSAGQATGSRPLQIAESVMENLPSTSASQLAEREAQKRAFTSAVLKRAGISGDTASAPVLLGQKQALGGTLGDIAKGGSIDFNKGLTDRLASIVDDASQHLPPDLASKVSGTVDKVLQQVGPEGSMAGTNYQGWREPLRGLAKNTETGRYFGQIRKALDEAFTSQAGEGYQATSRQYANLKTIIDSMGGSGALPAEGQIPPSALSSALARSIGKENKTLGGGDLNELARIGQAFIKDQIPNSGTAQRQAIQALLQTGGGSLLGGGAALTTGHDPLKGAAIGAGLGAGSIAAPRIAQALMNSPAGQAYLKQGLVSLTPAQRAALTAAIRSGAIGSAPSLLGQQPSQ